MRVEPDVISAWSHLVLTLSFSDKHAQTSSDLAKLHEDQMQRHKNANGEDHEKCGVKTRRVSSRVTNWRLTRLQEPNSLATVQAINREDGNDC